MILRTSSLREGPRKKHDLENLIVERGAEEEIDDFELFDGQRE